MPQAPRKDASSQRAQDKESKRARGALSCAECRRLKLKCDKTVPCSSCKRRGCSAICPNGSLITGQGTRFVLADTERLHQKIAQMSDRIRQLEDAVAILQSTQSSDPHPLLDRELLKIKSSIELHAAVEGAAAGDDQQIRHGGGDRYHDTTGGHADGGEDATEDSPYIDTFGTLAIRDDGAATFYGRSAGSESLLIGEATSPVHFEGSAARYGAELPPSVLALSAGFPMASTLFIYDIDIEYLVNSFLPSWSEACRLCQLYLDQAPWFFGAVTKRQIEEELLPKWYPEAPQALSPASQSSDESSHSDSQNRGTAHDLALLFVIFCFGYLTDMALPPAPDNVEAEQYFQLTKAALTLEPVMDRPPSVATVQTLSLMAIYEGLCSKENSIESTWSLMGLATKLAQSIGLHRDCARWKLPPAEVQKRRALFWELFITDCWQSLATGRLATFSLPFVDCELPSDPDQTMANDGTVQPSFPFWKARFGAECVSAVVQGTLTSRAPKYSIILELDRKVRDMQLPLYAQGSPPQGVGIAQTMSHFMPTNYRELTLLYIHRCFFAHAVSSHPLDPVKSQYAPSFLAGYRSACTIIGSVSQQFTMFPEQIARFWVLWTHAFSASVMLASVAARSLPSKVGAAALLELRTACDLFERAAPYGGRSVKFLPILKRLEKKAQEAFTNSKYTIPNDIFKPSSTEDEKDELSIFSGRTHTVATKATTPPARSSRASPSQSSNAAMSSRASSDSPKQSFIATIAASASTVDGGMGAVRGVGSSASPPYHNVHPNLLSELDGFDGQIRAQVHDAYRANNEIFGGVPIEPSSARNLQHVAMDQQGYQIQHHQQMDRLQMERREMERQHTARQELERRQQLEYEQQRHEERERQKAKKQRRQEDEYDQQHRLHERQQHYRYDAHAHDPHQRQSPSLQGDPTILHVTQATEPQHPLGPARMQQQSMGRSLSGHTLQTSRSQPNLNQAYHQQQQQQYHAPPPPSQPETSPQHSMYAVPQQYSQQYQSQPQDTEMQAPRQVPYNMDSTYDQAPSTFSSSSSSSTSPTVAYAARAPMQEYWIDAYRYWGNYSDSSGITVPSQPLPQFSQRHPLQQQRGSPSYPHYTPDGALKGIAADDNSLQETWQSYMYKVGTPRQFLED